MNYARTHSCVVFDKKTPNKRNSKFSQKQTAFRNSKTWHNQYYKNIKNKNKNCNAVNTLKYTLTPVLTSAGSPT